jgi:hypothetical protein
LTTSDTQDQTANGYLFTRRNTSLMRPRRDL